MKLISKILLVFGLSSINLIANAGSGKDYHASLFLGATTAHNHTYATAGVDLEKKMTDIFGLGLIVDGLVQSHSQTIAAVGLFYHPTEHLKFVLAPGVEFAHGHSESIVRIGAGYDFHLENGMSIGPVVNVDYLEHDTAVVYGITAGYSF